MKMIEKIDSDISDIRIKEIADMLLKGMRSNIIYDYCNSNYKIKNRQTDNLIKSAKNYIKSAGALDISFEKNLMLERLELLFGASFEANDFKTCASILKQKSEFLGLDAVPEQNITLSPLTIEMTNLTLDDEAELKTLRKFKAETLKKAS